MTMLMRTSRYGRLRRIFLFLLFAFCLASGLCIPSVHASPVADGMTLLLQEMPANYCALTFDDGPGPHTAALLDLLAERGVVATFFVLGQNAERRPALIKRMLAEGHEVANHGYAHANLRRLKPEAQFLEMKKGLDVLRALGAEVRYFRPPYGRYTPESVVKAEALGMTIMLWSLDSQDWKRHALRLEGLHSISPAVQRSFPGMRGVLLFHDTHKQTVDQMADILDALTAGGCERFVTVSEYLAKAPREEEQRLSTQAPNEGRGEIPPPSIAGSVLDHMAGDAPPGLFEDTESRRMPGAGMQTQAAHPVQVWKSANMRTQAAHGEPDRLETLAMGIVTHEPATAPAAQTQPNPMPPARPVVQEQPEKSAPLSLVRSAPPAAHRPQVSSAAPGGQIPQLRSDPGVILPTHKQDRGRPDTKRGASDPG